MPCLDSHISLNSHNWKVGCDAHIHLESLTGHLLSNPNLAKRVRSILFAPHLEKVLRAPTSQYSSAGQSLEMIVQEAIYEDKIAVAFTIIRNSFIVKAEQHIRNLRPYLRKYKQWIKDVWNGDQSAIAAVLFSVTPNLEILDLANAPSGFPTWLSHLLRKACGTVSANDSPPPFQKLGVVGTYHL